MSQSNGNSAPVKPSNIVRAHISVRGVRPLLQHAFGPSAIPLEDVEKTGVAGNDPEEWRRTMMVTPDGQLYIRDDYVFGAIRNGAKYTKKGRGSIQGLVAATLQVEEPAILLDRWLPKDSEPKHNDFAASVYIDVRGVRNPSTKGRNIRYRLASSAGWCCSFTLRWDRTIVSREQMRAVLQDTAVLVGFADGSAIGFGRFAVESFEELTDAEEAPAVGSVAEPAPDRMASGRKKVRAVPDAASAEAVPH